jgi:hypothetical protein
MSETTVASPAQPTQAYESDVELLLASSNAIQRLFAERQMLRERVMTLEHELQSLRSQARLVGDSYRKLTDEFVTQFKLIDNAVSNLFQDPESAHASPATKQPLGSDRSTRAA